MAKSTAQTNPNLGLYYGYDPLLVPDRALQDGRNFRIYEGRITNVNIGWTKFSQLNFGNPVMLIETFYLRSGSQKQIIATTRDIFEYTEATDTAVYLNPRYGVGTIDVAGTAVTVASGTPAWQTNGVKIGDYIKIGTADYAAFPGTGWIAITNVTNTTLTLASTGGTVSGQNYTIRRTFTGDLGDVFDSETFVNPDDGVGDDLFFVTNGLDSIITWNGTDSQFTQRSATLGFTCKRLAVYKNMMIYANIIYGSDLLPTSIINSDIGKPLAAGDAGTGLSEQFRIHDATDQIFELEDMGDNMVFYAERKIVLMQFVGDPLVFVFREAASGIGPISPRFLADFGDYHEFVGADSQYIFDGVSVTEVGKQLWREVLRQRDPTRQQFSFVHFDEERGDLYWIIPLTSDATVGQDNTQPEEAFVEHYLEEIGDRTPTPMSRREMPFCCSGYAVVIDALTWDEVVGNWDDLVIRWNDSFLFSAFPLNLMGSTDGYVYKLNTVQTGNGADLTSYVRFGRRLLGDGRMRGLMARVYPFVEQFNVPLTVRTRLADHAAGPVTTVDEQTFDTTLVEGGHFVTPYRRGRYYELEFATEGYPFNITGYDTEIRAGGYR